MAGPQKPERQKVKPRTEVERLLQDYLNYLEIEKNRSPRTSENYQHYLREFLKFAKISSPAEITDSVVREFRVALARRELKRITQGYYAIALRNFLKYLVKRDIKTLSAEKIELPKIPGRQIDTLEYGDLERLLAAPKGDSLRDLRDKAVLRNVLLHRPAVGRALRVATRHRPQARRTLRARQRRQAARGIHLRLRARGGQSDISCGEARRREQKKNCSSASTAPEK